MFSLATYFIMFFILSCSSEEENEVSFKPTFVMNQSNFLLHNKTRTNSVSFSLLAPNEYVSGVTPRIKILNIDSELNYEAALGTLTSQPEDIVSWTDIADNHQFTGLSLSDCSVYFISLRTRDGEGNYGATQTSWALTATSVGPGAPTIDSIDTDHNLHSSPTVQMSPATDQCGNKVGYLAELIDVSEETVVARTNQSASSFRMTNLALDYGESYYFRIKSVDIYGGESSSVTSSSFQPSTSGVFDNLDNNSYTTNEDVALSLNKASLLPELSESTRDQTSVTAISVSNGSITESTENNWVFIPPGNFNGNITLSFSVQLGSETSSESRVITVNAVADMPTTAISAFSLSEAPLTTADFSAENESITFDPTISIQQTVGDTSDRWSVSSVTGSSHDDTFFFSSLSNSDSYTVTGGSGQDTISLEKYPSNLVTINNNANTITIDLGNSNSASISYSSIENFIFSSNVFDGNPHAIDIKSNHHNWNIVGKNISVLSPADEDEAIAVLKYNGTLDSNFNLETSVLTDTGNWANGGIIFDYIDEDNFKVVVARVGLQKWSIERMSSGSLSDVAQTPVIPSMARGVTQNMELRVVGSVASIYSEGVFQVSHDFGEALNDGKIGVMVDNARTDFVLSMAPSNWAPSVKDVNLTMQQRDETLITPNLLGLAFDPEAASLSYSNYSTPSGGKRILNSDNTFTYTPWFNFIGNDSFSYTVSDGVNSSTGTIKINVFSDASVTIADGGAFKINLGLSHEDRDGSESIVVLLRNLPIGSTITDGSSTITTNSVETDISSLDYEIDLTIDPPTTGSDFDVTVVTTSTESSNSDEAFSTNSFSVAISD